MPIFGAKSRAARGCASKLACGRRIDPHDARPFLRNAAANPRLPNGRTGSSAPTGRFAVSPNIMQFCDCAPTGRCGHRPLRTDCVVAVRCAILRVHPARERENPSPTAIGIDCTGSHWCARFFGCVPPGGQGRPPLRVRTVFASVHQNLRRRTARAGRAPPLRYDETR